MSLERQTREDDMLNRENIQRRWGVVDRGLHRQQRTRRASRVIVAVMQVGPALLSVRDRTRFIARQCQRRANDPELADDDQ